MYWNAFLWIIYNLSILKVDIHVPLYVGDNENLRSCILSGCAAYQKHISADDFARWVNYFRGDTVVTFLFYYISKRLALHKMSKTF